MSGHHTFYVFRTNADGDCLYNAVSLAPRGNEQLSHLLRALTSAELYLHSDFYSPHPRFIALFATEKSSGLVDTYFSHSLTHEASDLLTRSVKRYSDYET